MFISPHDWRSKRIQGVLGGIFLHAHGWTGLAGGSLVTHGQLGSKLIAEVHLRDPHVMHDQPLVVTYVKMPRMMNGMFYLHPKGDESAKFEACGSLDVDAAIIANVLDIARQFLLMRKFKARRDRASVQEP